MARINGSHHIFTKAGQRERIVIPIHGNYRYHLMLRTHAIQRLSRHLAGVLEKLTFPDDAIVTVDVDAYQLL